MMSEIEKYIKKILDLVFTKDDLDQILFDLTIFAEHIGYNSIVKSTTDEAEARRILVRSQLDNITSGILRNYLTELLEKDELWIFDPGHIKTFADNLNEIAAKTVFFNLTTAIQLKDEDLRALSEMMSKKMERKVVVHLTVDHNILGGAVIKKDNFILDYSLKTKMNNLASQWKKSIQKAG